MNLYRTLLGDRFNELPPVVRTFHDPNGTTVWLGEASVHQGGLIAKIVCALFGFPASAKSVPLELIITPTEVSEHWVRDFGGKKMTSVQTQRNGMLIEKFGLVKIYMTPMTADETFSVRPERWTFLSLPLPRALMPKSENRETEENGQLRFDVSIKMPLVGHIVTYRGWLAMC